MRNILVATDFSADSGAAFEQALELAVIFGAKLHLLHAYYVHVPMSPGGFLVLPHDVVISTRAEAQSRLEALVKRVGDRVPVAVHLSAADPVSAIIELAQEVSAELVVVGTRGLTGIKHVLLGSVAERTVRLAPCPVLTVKAERPPAE